MFDAIGVSFGMAFLPGWLWFVDQLMVQIYKIPLKQKTLFSDGDPDCPRILISLFVVQRRLESR